MDPGTLPRSLQLCYTPMVINPLVLQWQGMIHVLTSASWFDNIMINHEMPLKVTMFFENLLVIFGG